MIRHATRASSFDHDTPLSAVGHAQASQAVEVFAQPAPGAGSGSSASRATPPQPTRIFVSPKLRARQTVAPLAQSLGLPPEVDERLDERTSDESRQSFHRRIQDFLHSIESSATATSDVRVDLVCSHMDWLEDVLPLMNSTMNERDLSASWAAGGYRVFECTEDSIWNLVQTGALPER